MYCKDDDFDLKLFIQIMSSFIIPFAVVLICFEYLPYAEKNRVFPYSSSPLEYFCETYGLGADKDLVICEETKYVVKRLDFDNLFEPKYFYVVKYDSSLLSKEQKEKIKSEVKAYKKEIKENEKEHKKYIVKLEKQNEILKKEKIQSASIYDKIKE